MVRSTPRPPYGTLMPLFAVATLLAAVPVPGAARQATERNPLSACFRVAVAPTPSEAARNVVRGEVVEFVFEPSHAPSLGLDRSWRLNESSSTETVAFWWLEGEELVAIWPTGDSILTLRLAIDGFGLSGTAHPTLDPDGESARVAARPVGCRSSAGD